MAQTAAAPESKQYSHFILLSHFAIFVTIVDNDGKGG
jgi:hypothetical protein